MLAKITPRTLKNTPSPDKNINLPEINPDPLGSNIYSVGERIVLAWLNHHYEHHRQKIWQNCSKGGVPPARWIVNYDFDLLDGLVIGAVLGAHMPFLVSLCLQLFMQYYGFMNLWLNPDSVLTATLALNDVVCHCGLYET